MEFKEFSEFPDLEEEDFDIKHAISSEPNNSNEEDPYANIEVDSMETDWGQILDSVDDSFLEEDSLDNPNAIDDAIEVPEESELEEDSLDVLANPEPVVEVEDILEEDSLEDLGNPEPIEEDITVIEEDGFDPKEWGLDQEDLELEEDIFEDENIQETLQKYNYDYQTLVMMLFAFSGDDEIIETLEACGLTQNDYYHPTAETFELMRNHMINSHKHKM